MCVFLFRSSRSKNDERKRERDKSRDESKKKRRKDHFFSSFLCKQTPQEEGQSFGICFFFFFSFCFLQNTNEKVEKLRFVVKIYMDVWI